MTGIKNTCNAFVLLRVVVIYLSRSSSCQAALVVQARLLWLRWEGVVYIAREITPPIAQGTNIEQLCAKIVKGDLSEKIYKQRKVGR